MSTGFKNIEKKQKQLLQDELDKIGVLCRIFGRTKSLKSIQDKIIRKSSEGKTYSPSGPHMQDLIGIRIITYFIDDIKLIRQVIQSKFSKIDETIDSLDTITFKPKRTNLICWLEDSDKETFTDSQTTSPSEVHTLFSPTIEIQLRTILSEGWHEIDHNLRYKCKADWEQHSESERMLNGIYASLETSDNVMANLFNELTYKHFNSMNWQAMLRNKFRLKFDNKVLDANIVEILNKKPELAKSILKCDRMAVLLKLYNQNLHLPVSLSNFVYAYNVIFSKDEDLLAITPEVVKSEIK